MEKIVKICLHSAEAVKNFIQFDEFFSIKIIILYLQIEFEYKSLVFHMFDVGGQRSERKKWIHCFDNVDCVLFVVAMSEYDQMLVEDRCVNRMHESLSLFEEIVNNEFFSEMPFIVFFNKKDLFDQKVRIKSIRVAFPTYQVLCNQNILEN